MRGLLQSLWIFVTLCSVFIVDRIKANDKDFDKGSPTVCQTDLCSPTSLGLRCPLDTAIHIHRMYCSSSHTGTSSGRHGPDEAAEATATAGGDSDSGAMVECPWSNYVNLYSLCEGSNRCDASGLQLLLGSSCRRPNGGMEGSVMVDYYCVQERQMYDSCSSAKFRRVQGEFGVISSPKSFSVPASVATQCKWGVPSIRNRTNKIVVHTVYRPSTSGSGCAQEFLKITYTDCESGRALSKSYCSLEKIREELLSCGPAHMTSSVHKGQTGSFVLSYYVNIGANANTSPSSNVAICLPSQSSPPSPASSQPRTTTATKSAAAQGKSRNDDSKDSRPLYFDPKFLFMYIGLGVLILILICALLVVIVRYRRLPDTKNHKGDSSERIFLWHQSDDTPLDTFGHNGLVQPTANGMPPGNFSDEVIATVHHDALTDNDPDLDPRLSTTSGFSTFLSDKRDSGFKDLIKSLQTGTFGSSNGMPDNSDRMNDASWNDYYELPENGRVGSEIYQSIDRDLGNYPQAVEASPNLSHSDMESHNHDRVTQWEQQPLVPASSHSSDEYHYHVNDDEYALVRKPKRLPFSDNTQRSKPVQPSRSNRSSYQDEAVDFRPASGSFEKRNGHANDRPNSAVRWSKGKQLLDEV